MSDTKVNTNLATPENLVYKKTSVMNDTVLHYCPGCGHGTVHRIIAEVVEEMDIQSDVIGIAPVGCSVLMYNYMELDMQEPCPGPGLCQPFARCAGWHALVWRRHNRDKTGRSAAIQFGSFYITSKCSRMPNHTGFIRC